MKNQFEDTYKKLSTEKLLEILESSNDYQPLAIEAARQELANRTDLKEAKNKYKENKIDLQNKINHAEQELKIKRDKANKIFEYADPLLKKTPKKSVLILSVILLFIFLFKTAANFNTIVASITSINESDFSTFLFLLEYFFFLIAIYFVWKSLQIGWIMLLIWLLYCIITDFVYLYFCYKLLSVHQEVLNFIAMPTFTTQIPVLAFHCGILYFILKPEIKIIFWNNTNKEGAI